MIATTKQECFNLTSQQDTPANNNDLVFVIYDKDGSTILESDTEENALYAYQQFKEARADEGYVWQDWVEIYGINADGDEVSRRKLLALMDTRRESER